MKAFQAYATGCTVVSTESPKAAAIEFFSKNPTKRKCNVTQGALEGHFFVVKYGRVSEGEWPQSFKDVTRKTMMALPG